MALSAFEHPFLSGLFGDEQISALFSAEADVAAMVRFEVALARAQAKCGLIEPDVSDAIASALSEFVPNMDALRSAVAIDGVVVPELVRQIRKAVGSPASDKAHLGATSQDVIDTSLVLRLKSASDILQERLVSAIAALDDLRERHGRHSLMGYTRMQAAIPITMADRVRSWVEPLRRDLHRLGACHPACFVVQFGGAAGTLEKLGDKGPAVRSALARELGLADGPQWHSQRDGIAEFSGVLSLISGALGKLGQDVALMAELGTGIRLSGGGGSSAMPHKQNPVAAETLVALARFNATQLSGIHHSLVHEQERSGAAWALEWLILPQMTVATGVSLKTAIRLVGQIDVSDNRRNTSPTSSDR
jgi:3-carboxy-cis,cis-muconate cycloisomerase